MIKQFEEGEAGILIHRNAVLSFTVLGGVKLEGLDRLVVTLMVQVMEGNRPAVRHKLDLYNDNQTSKFGRTLAGKLEIGLTVVEASLSELTDLLEVWRLTEIRKQSAEEVRIVPLTSEQESAALARLRMPGLLTYTGEQLGASGIIGEERNRMILYVAMTSRLLDSPISVFCLARSGVGKSYLQERVAACMPDHSKLENTQFTENSFYYFGRRELSHMIVLIEDMDGAQNVLFPIRELQSKKRISKTVTEKDKNGKLKTRTVIVEGPVCVIGSTTKETIYEDNANRSIMIHLDDSKEQDARVNAHTQALDAAQVDGDRQHKAQEELQHMQRVLRPIKVVNPYAPLITLPEEVFKPRRTLGLLLGFIKAITFYHQQQREEKADEATGEVFIESTVEDVEAAFDLLSDTLFRKADELSGASRSLLEWIRKNENGAFTGQAIRKRLRMAPRTLTRYLGELTAYGYVIQDRKKKHSAGYSYTLAGDAGQELPEAIARQVAQVIANVKAAATKPTPAAPVKRGPGRPRKVRVEEVGQSATVGQEEVGRPTQVDHSDLEQVGLSATEVQVRS
jgi:hypothetical protein